MTALSHMNVYQEFLHMGDGVEVCQVQLFTFTSQRCSHSNLVLFSNKMLHPAKSENSAINYVCCRLNKETAKRVLTDSGGHY